MTMRVPSPERIQKYPWGAVTFVLFSVCIALVFALINRPKCDSDDWKKAYQEEREKNDKLTTSLLVTNKVIERIKSTKDSTSNTLKNENVN